MTAPGVLRGRPTIPVRAMFLLVVNYAVLAVEASRSSRPPLGAFVAATVFWGGLALLPGGLNRQVLFSPRNYIVFLFFFSMVVGPSVMLFGELLPRLWILNSATWDIQEVGSYMLPAALLWSLAFVTYLLVQSRRRKPAGNPALTDHVEREPPADWMMLTGLALIGAGVVGLTIATGSFQSAFSLGGRRAASEAALGAGSYRFSGWMEGVPLGAALVWYCVTQRMRVGRLGAAVWILLLYLPLLPLYLYTSGRARALIPLLLLIAMYHRFIHPFRARWLIVGLVLLIPTLSLWSLYRGNDELELQNDRVNTVLASDFSRFEVSTVAVAGFEESGLAYYMGETFWTAATYWIPGVRGLGGVDGTTATAQALAGDPTWQSSSSYATSLVTESYLNFGVAGIVVVFALLSVLMTWLDQKAISSSLLVTLLAWSTVLKLPFAVSTAIGVSQVMWAVGLPFALAWLAKSVLSPTTRREPVRPAVPVPGAVQSDVGAWA